MRPQTNIYGEPIETTPAAPIVAAAQTPLTAAIEREVIPSQQTVRTAPERGAESLREVRRAAEELLRAGRDLEFVARRTNLTIDEVRLLSNAVLRESARRTAPVESTIIEQKTEADPAMLGADPRLGALSPIRRSIETV
jgi:hypothetical protein